MSTFVGQTTLQQIRQKIRRVTGTPSANQLSDIELNEYINTFYLYDLPEHLRLLKLKTTYEFFTQPNVDKYPLPDETVVSVEPPVYVGGYQARYLQNREIFFMRWPPLNQYQQIGEGDGSSPTPPLQNIFSVPIIQDTLYISAYRNGLTVTYNDDGAGAFNSAQYDIQNISVIDAATGEYEVLCANHPFVNGQLIRISATIGSYGLNNQEVTIASVVSGVSFRFTLLNPPQLPYTGKGFAQRVGAGAINYTTGVLSMDWGFAPDAGSIIQAQFIFYTTSRPYDVLFYDQTFYLRPVPDKPYKVVINAFVQPTALFDNSDLGDPSNSPDLREWWQMIAYGASLKIFADRADFDQYNQFLPLFEEQKLLSQRRTLKQLTNQRVSTIYEAQNLWPLSNFYPYS